MRIFVFTLLFLFIHSGTIAQKPSKSIRKLDAYMETMLTKWNIPGMAVAIIDDNQVVLSKGYGVKNVNTGEKVDEHSLFAMASNSKAFTSAALAILVDEGKLNWDDKVQKYLPWFQLYDPYVSANMTVRDLLCHRSGLATFSGDLLWYGTTHNREEVIRRARHLEPKYGFREAYGYQNIMFLTAGEIIPVITGLTWEEFVEERFFEPLGMSHTVTSINQFTSNTNKATPHNEINGKNVAIEWVNWDNIAPAGGINSSVHDMSKWLQLQLNQGVWNSDTLFTASRAKEMWSVQTPQNVSAWSEKTFPGKSFSGYGLGWELSNFRGRKIVAHGGGYDGMISRTVLVPSEGIGIVILTNNINFLPYALEYQILDELFGEKNGENYGKLFLEYKKQGAEDDLKSKEEEAKSRIVDTSPSLPLSDYAGTYTDEMYGDVEVRLIGDQLAFQFVPTSIFRGTLRHWHYDTFQLNWGTQMMLPSGKVQFGFGSDGKIKSMDIDVPNPDFDFTELKFKKVY
jgi:CubicO group peptidase (beta-lactamase class C family)